MQKLQPNFTGNSIYFIILLLIISVLIPSCSHKKKNDNEFVIKKGLIYRNDSKIPYTGKRTGFVKGIKIEYDVLNGVKTGELNTYYKNGTLQMTGHLVSNKNQGLWKYYYPDSSMESQGYFKDDIPEGKWTWYYDKGGIKGTGSFVSGKREGEWIDFDKKGKITLKKIFKNGIEVKSKKVKKKSDKI